MARKRMFDSEIINQDSFLEMPMDAKALYFLLGMEADDEGFVSYKRVLRLYGGSEDSIKILATKNYIIPFKSGVIVITDWKRNNYLDKNRIKETIYQNEKSLIFLNKKTEKYELINDSNAKSLTDVKQMLNQNSIEENSIDNIYSQKQELLTDTNIVSQEVENTKKQKEQELIEHFNLTWKRYPNKKGKAKAQELYFQWIKGRKISKTTIKLTDKQMYYAVAKYAKECEENGTEQQYIKHGDTFFNKAILDYVEEKDE